MTSRATTTNVGNVVGPVHFHQWRIRAPMSPKQVWTTDNAQNRADPATLRAAVRDRARNRRERKRRARKAASKLREVEAERWCRVREKMYVADEELTAEDIQRSRRLFNMIDEEKEGTVSYDELMESFRFCGYDPDPVAIQDIVNNVDMNKSGVLNFPEFLSMTSSKTKKEAFLSLGKRGVPPIDAWILAYNRRKKLNACLGTKVRHHQTSQWSQRLLILQHASTG